MFELKDRIKPKDWNGQPYNFQQVKMDGHRLTLIKEKNELSAFGRKPLNVSHKLQEYGWYMNFKEYIPNGTVLDGEVYVKGGTSSDVSTHLASKHGKLLFSTFAVPYWGFIDYKMATLNSVENILWNATGNELTEYFEYNWTGNSDREGILKEAEDLGVEGFVLKQWNYSCWYKIKPTRTIDCFVTGYKDGEGKYLGGVGALKVSVLVDGESQEIALVSGMDDATRWNIDEVNNMFRVCEVEYQRWGSRGRLIHPRFLRWRDDKPREECILER